MNFAKCLLVALCLWMPAATFAAAAIASVAVEHAAPCEEAPAAEEMSDQNELFFPSSVTPMAHTAQHTFDRTSQRVLDGHVVEIFIPPPNPAA
ncbi:MAG: hypothetical protein HYX59_07705 [Elusimicrobia bacterium]|nr:hypothetical protein [Elusimicrobiota bacterium]